jgi:hypothetical protein
MNKKSTKGERGQAAQAVPRYLPMAIPIQTWHLANGLIIEISDESVNYFGDYFSLKIIVKCDMTVQPAYVEAFSASARYQQVLGLLGPKAEYRREITKPGVFAKDLLGVKAAVIESFEKNALPYFERADFAEKFVRKRFAEIEEELSKAALREE